MSKGTCTTIQLLATGVIAFLSEKLGITFYLLGLLVFLMVVDYISGMIASMVEATETAEELQEIYYGADVPETYQSDVLKAYLKAKESVGGTDESEAVR